MHGHNEEQPHRDLPPPTPNQNALTHSDLPYDNRGGAQAGGKDQEIRKGLEPRGHASLDGQGELGSGWGGSGVGGPALPPPLYPVNAVITSVT